MKKPVSEPGASSPEGSPSSDGAAVPPAGASHGLSRREMLTRVGTTGLVLAGAAALSRLRWDKGGFGVHAKEGERQVRDFRLKEHPPVQFKNVSQPMPVFEVLDGLDDP